MYLKYLLLRRNRGPHNLVLIKLCFCLTEEKGSGDEGEEEGGKKKKKKKKGEKEEKEKKKTKKAPVIFLIFSNLSSDSHCETACCTALLKI